MIRTLIDNNMHILLIGPTGTAKSVSAIDACREFYNNKKCGNMTLNFSG
jgi:hypothetical protein